MLTKKIVGSKGEPVKNKSGWGVQAGGRSASPRNAYQDRSTYKHFRGRDVNQKISLESVYNNSAGEHAKKNACMQEKQLRSPPFLALLNYLGYCISTSQWWVRAMLRRQCHLIPNHWQPINLLPKPARKREHCRWVHQVPLRCQQVILQWQDGLVHMCYKRRRGSSKVVLLHGRANKMGHFFG